MVKIIYLTFVPHIQLVVLNRFNLEFCHPNAASIKFKIYFIFGNITQRVANSTNAKTLFYSLSNADSMSSAANRITFNFEEDS